MQPVCCIHGHSDRLSYPHWCSRKCCFALPSSSLRGQRTSLTCTHLSWRGRYVEAFGCCRWTDEALSTVAAFSPLIEIGAGHGHWQVRAWGRPKEGGRCICV